MELVVVYAEVGIRVGDTEGELDGGVKEGGSKGGVGEGEAVDGGLLEGERGLGGTEDEPDEEDDGEEGSEEGGEELPEDGRVEVATVLVLFRCAVFRRFHVQLRHFCVMQ